GVEDLAADVVEVDVDPLGAELAQARRDVLALVVDRRVEVRLLGEPATLFGAARDADHAATLELRDLSRHRAGRPGRARDHDGPAGLGLAQIEQPEVRGQPRDPANAERPGRRRALRELGRAHEPAVPRDSVLLPAEHPLHEIADGVVGALRLDDLADRAG